MPYILIRRGDIPTGTLQTALDLKPNTSQRRYPYLNPGQTKYTRNVLAEGSTAPRVSGAGPILTVQDGEGLASWFLGAASDGSGAAATGSLTTIAVADLLDGETFTISDGTSSKVFEFKVTAPYTPTVGNLVVDVSGVATADEVRDSIIGVITALSDFDISAADGGAATVDLTNDNPNLTPAAVNVTITDTVANVGFVPAGMAGGTASVALTDAEASTNAADVLAIVEAGTALDLATVNAALTTGALTPGQHSDLMDLLAGRRYVLPSGSQIENSANEFELAVPEGETAGFLEGTLRNLYNTGAMRISIGEGRLSKMLSADFRYAGVSGPAVTVYNDDGTLYTP